MGRSPTYGNPVAAENARPGEPGLRSVLASFAHELEAYVDRVSARAGDAVGVHASVDVAHGVMEAVPGAEATSS